MSYITPNSFHDNKTKSVKPKISSLPCSSMALISPRLFSDCSRSEYPRRWPDTARALRRGKVERRKRRIPNFPEAAFGFSRRSASSTATRSALGGIPTPGNLTALKGAYGCRPGSLARTDRLNNPRTPLLHTPLITHAPDNQRAAVAKLIYTNGDCERGCKIDFSQVIAW